MASIPRKYKHVNLIHNLCDIPRKPYMFKALKMRLYFVVINHFVKNKCYKMLYISLFPFDFLSFHLTFFFCSSISIYARFSGVWVWEREKAEVKHGSLLNRTETTACLSYQLHNQSSIKKCLNISCDLFV